jgi:hypothetical protein
VLGHVCGDVEGHALVGPGLMGVIEVVLGGGV